MALLTASAPGKVLVCGGYLVVESPNPGLAIGVDARFNTTVTENTLVQGDGPITVTVASPQFGANFTFEATYTAANDDVTVKQTAGPNSPFMYYGVLTTLAYMRGAGALGTGSIALVLQADNDFYSQRNYLEAQGKKVTAETLRTVPKFNVLVGDVSKTGLGSSAALTTSFVACLGNALSRAAWLGGEALNTETVHRLAQAAHSVAQGKIGSGFDVHTAVYGTSVYVRFPTSCVDALMADKQPTSFSAARVRDVVDLAKAWVPERPITVRGLPRGMKLVLADIHQGGSATPGMVAKIMAWRKSVAATPGNTWDRLGAANRAYLESLAALHAAANDEGAAYDAAVDTLRQQPCATWAADGAIVDKFIAAREKAAETRALLREVGVASEVEVEPPVLTPLLDATMKLPGVIAAGCPGAGGYDAIFALVLGGEEELRRTEAFWEEYPGLHVCPLLVREAAEGLTVKDATA